MARKRCRACRGEYQETMPDGTTYFHVCPPRRLVRVRHADGSIEVVRPNQVLGTDVVVSDVFRPRPDHRDENTRDWIQDAAGSRRVIRAEGAGVEDAPELPDREPAPDAV